MPQELGVQRIEHTTSEQDWPMLAAHLKHIRASNIIKFLNLQATQAFNHANGLMPPEDAESPITIRMRSVSENARSTMISVIDDLSKTDLKVPFRTFFDAVAFSVFKDQKLPAGHLIGIPLDNIQELFTRKAIDGLNAFSQDVNRPMNTLDDFMIGANFIHICPEDGAYEAVIPHKDMF